MSVNLMLHTGAHSVEREALMAVPTPAATDTWQPVSHMGFLETVESTLKDNGIQIGAQAHGITNDGQRYFGLLEVMPESAELDILGYTKVLGLRNCHDKRFAAGLCCGNQVLVCDNLAFVGEFKLSRKHTSRVLEELPMLVHNTIGTLTAVWKKQDERIRTYKSTGLSDELAINNLVIQGLDAGVYPASKIPKLLDEWREPKHEEFQERNVWSWFNSVTEVIKGNLNLLPARTEGLYQICDDYSGIDPDHVEGLV